MRIHEYLEIDENKNIKCIKCRHVLCNAKDNYKKYALRKEISGKGIGKYYVQDDDFVVYHEFYCPGCLTLLSSDILPKDEEPIWDIEIKI